MIYLSCLLYLIKMLLLFKNKKTFQARYDGWNPVPWYEQRGFNVTMMHLAPGKFQLSLTFKISKKNNFCCCKLISLRVCYTKITSLELGTMHFQRIAKRSFFDDFSFKQCTSFETQSWLLCALLYFFLIYLRDSSFGSQSSDHVIEVGMQGSLLAQVQIHCMCTKVIPVSKQCNSSMVESKDEAFK